MRLDALQSAWIAGVAVLCTPVFTMAQSYPLKPIRIIVPVQPGGGLDPQARLLGRKFQESMGQSVVVENRPGANGMIGTELVAKSPGDGYTLLCAAASIASAVTLSSSVGKLL